MFTRKSCGIVFVVLFAAALLPCPGRQAGAQDRGSKPPTNKPLNKGFIKKKPTAPVTPATGASNKKAEPSDGGSSAEKNAASASEAEPSPGLAGWIRQNWKWVIGAPLVAAVLGLSWFLLAGRRNKEDSVGAILTPIDAEADQRDDSSGGYSSTRIRAVDVDSRLSGSMDGEEVETDQDYALVVEEEALSATDPQAAGSPEEVIDAFLQGGDTTGAYETYSRLIDEPGSDRLDAELEQRLGESLVAAGQVERAATVLEHLIATQPTSNIEPSSYFNLGYAHFHAQNIEKSRQRFAQFIDTEQDEKRCDRARAILEALESGRT